MDDTAARILANHIDPDAHDPQLADIPDARPDLPASVLLEVLHGYQRQCLDQDTEASPREISALEALTATRVLAEDLIAAYGWLINDARREGASWADIGSALRMSKQAAWERAQSHMTANREKGKR